MVNNLEINQETNTLVDPKRNQETNAPTEPHININLGENPNLER